MAFLGEVISPIIKFLNNMKYLVKSSRSVAGIIMFFVAIIFFGHDSIAQKTARIIREVNWHEIKKGTATYAIIGARIIDGNGGEPIENGVVIVSNGIITAVGTRETVKIPASAITVDATGLSLLPGFIDAHFHIDGMDDLPGMFLQHGVTSVRDPGAWMETYDSARRMPSPQPRMFLAGPHIDMFPPAYPSDAYVVRDAAEAVTQVNRAADQGASMIKAYFRLPPSIIREVCIAAHKRGIPVSAHLETTEAMEAIDAGLDGIEHITSFGLTLIDKREGEKFRQKVLADNNARKEGRYQVWSKINIKGRMADSLTTFLLRKKTFVDPTLGAFEYRAGEDGKTDSAKMNGFANMKAMTGVLANKNVRIVLGSHSMIKYAEKGWAYQREMELFAESGISNSRIIVAATIENARFFRIQDRIGSIGKGKIADLVLVKGNPLENISDARNVVKVMLNGVWVRE
jgi:imidazolonepropionase-like amidohydrolase